MKRILLVLLLVILTIISCQRELNICGDFDKKLNRLYPKENLITSINLTHNSLIVDIVSIKNDTSPNYHKYLNIL